jgi:putative ABC transport system substrate-binding protein
MWSVTIASCAVLLWAVAGADDNQTIPRIGALVPSVPNSPLEAGLRDGLRDLGYIESKDFIFEWRRSSQTPEALRPMAEELVKSRVTLIVAMGSPAARAAMEASSTIPVVFTSGDPVGAGFVSSLARPGRNATGVSVLSTDLDRKALELLHEIAPRARRIAYLINPSNPLAPEVRTAVQAGAQSLKLQLIPLDATNVAELELALRAIQRSDVQALLCSGDLLFLARRNDIAHAVRAAKLPAIFPYPEYHDAEVLMSYGPGLKQAMYRVAGYVDKILKGAAPGQLPVEQLSEYEFVINMRLARDLGVHVPQNLLMRADHVIQ